MGIIKDRVLAKAGARLAGADRIRRGLWTGTDAEPAGTDTEYTVTGNPAVFNTNIRRNLTKLEVPLLPVMSGSGTPSPSNVRPISGWSGVTVTANGQTILAAWESVAGVVYGGTVDLVTGVMTVTWEAASAKWGDIKTGEPHETTGYYKGYLYFDYEPVVSYNQADIGIKVVSNIMNWASWVGNNKTPEHYYIPKSADKRAVISGNWDDNTVIPIAVKLLNPYTVQLTPVEIKTIIGQNSIATATGGMNTIKYLKRG